MFFFTAGSLYLFGDSKTIFLTTSIQHIKFNRYLDVPCLLDLDYNTPLPYKLFDFDLFFLQATYPNPKNTEWIKQRRIPVKFVLNPPSEEEIVQAFVFYSLFLRP